MPVALEVGHYCTHPDRPFDSGQAATVHSRNRLECYKADKMNTGAIIPRITAALALLLSLAPPKDIGTLANASPSTTTLGSLEPQRPSKYSSLTESELKWYRNPRDLDVFEEYFTFAPTPPVIMPHVAASKDMTKVEIESGFGKCSDGSNPVYYIAYGQQPTKWVIFLEGGDWCTRYTDLGDKDSKRNCLERRKRTGLQGGTTREDPETLDLRDMGRDYGQLDLREERNPLMHDWNKLYIRNCDGSSFTSARRGVKKVGDEEIYFRGKFILDDIVSDLLDNRHLGLATEVVISGCSAGGLAVYLHTDRIAAEIRRKAEQLGRLRSSIKVVALADSGFFLHHAGGEDDCHFVERMKFVYREMNITDGLQPSCVEAFDESERYKCLFAENALRFSKSRTFTMQSIEDGWQLRWIGCRAAEDEEKRKWYGNEMLDVVMSANKGGNRGAFIDACQHHCHCYEDIVIDGVNQARAFAQFYSSGQRRIWMSRSCDLEDMGGECPLKRG